MDGSVCLCLIVKDEEATLPRCLASVRDLVDGCVIVDTGSTDGTRAVARRYDVALFEEPWADDFAQARNAAFDRVPAAFDFIFWLDADDVLLEADRQRFRVLKAQLGRTDANAISMLYHYAFDDQGGVLLKFRLLRVVRRASHFRWVGRVHEYLEGPGPIMDSDVVVTHRRERAATDRNLRIYENMQASGAPFTVRDCLYYANELMDHGRFAEARPWYERVAGDASAWVEDRIWALNQLAEGFGQLGDGQAVREAMYHTFDLDAPRSEACCRLGYEALQRGALPSAVFWYLSAVQVAQVDTAGFRIEACHTWLPHLQLAVAYAQLGELGRAAWHNEVAGTWRPQDPYVLHNREFFRQRGIDPERILTLGDGGRSVPPPL